MFQGFMPINPFFMQLKIGMTPQIQVRVFSTLLCMIGESALWRERDSYLYQNILINQRLRWFYYLKTVKD